MKTLLKEPERFSIEVYNPIINKDTFRYVFESKQSPSYHMDKNCEKLNSDFKNFEIPFEIKARATEKAKREKLSEEETHKLVENKVNTFRHWFMLNFKLFKEDTNAFLRKLEVQWNIRRKISEIELNNSGVEHIENVNLNELEAEIDKILREAAKYFKTNTDKQNIIRRFQKLTFLAYKNENIRINDTELSDDELKSFLKKYDQQFKQPIKKLLIEYYRVKYNKDMTFDGKLLESLNFRPCSKCCA